MCKSLDIVDCDVALATLNSPNIGTVQAGPVCHLFLLPL